MENLPVLDEANQIFSYDGIPVGYFGGGIVPSAPGTYRYMPFRSLGHYLMGKELDAGGRPTCSYKRGGSVMRFEVQGRGGDKQLHLAAFTRSDQD